MAFETFLYLAGDEMYSEIDTTSIDMPPWKKPHPKREW
jgi:hypothetical protein